MTIWILVLLNVPGDLKLVVFGCPSLDYCHVPKNTPQTGQRLARKIRSAVEMSTCTFFCTSALYDLLYKIYTVNCARLPSFQLKTKSFRTGEPANSGFRSTQLGSVSCCLTQARVVIDLRKYERPSLRASRKSSWNLSCRSQSISKMYMDGFATYG
jgi:hypothetical protein